MSISVLMSVYQSEAFQYLDRALQSIWTDQTLKPNEVILIQDGKLGNELLAVISKWQNILEDKLIIHCNKENLGLTKSLNIGLTYATGKYIARMDSDDISHPQRFEKQVAFLNEHPEVSVVGGSLQEFNSDNICLNVRHYPHNDTEVLKYIYKASPLAHPTVMIRRSLFVSGLRYNEKYRTSQDIALWFDALCAGFQIANIDDVTIYFRRENDVFKRRSREKAFNEFNIYIFGIYRLYGLLTWKYIYPISRLCFRLLPVSAVKWIYDSKFRKILLNK